MFLTLFTVVFSCSKVETLEKRTENMEDDMKSMKGTTEQLDKKMENMDENMELIKEDGRQAVSSTSRKDEFAILRDEDIPMGAKISAAKRLFYAFENQLWTGRKSDTEEVRNILFKDAVDELYEHLADFYRGYNAQETVVFINDANANYQAFFAIAATMHFNNSKQEMRLKGEQEFEIISMYDIIKTALKKYRENQALNDYEKVIIRGKNLKMTIDLLNARMNFITLLAVQDLVTEPEMFDEKWRDAARFKMNENWGDGLNLIDVPFEEQNMASKEEIIYRLDGALKTKNLILENTFPMHIDKGLTSLIENMSKPNEKHLGMIEKEDRLFYEFLYEISEIPVPTADDEALAEAEKTDDESSIKKFFKSLFSYKGILFEDN